MSCRLSGRPTLHGPDEKAQHGCSKSKQFLMVGGGALETHGCEGPARLAYGTDFAQI
jgi:hypothetical protein